MLVSVVIPVYNGEKTISQTIDSVLKQSIHDIEVIVINDGSNDLTSQIVSHIQDLRVKMFSYSHSGASVSRNKGIQNSIGEYIAFIDADDIWTSDKLELQLKALTEHPQAKLAYSWTDYIDFDGNFIKHGRHVSVTGNVYGKLLLSNFLENGSNPLISRYVFETIGGFNESLVTAEDWDMWLRIAAQYEFVCVEKAQVFYRVNPNSLSTDLTRMAADSLHVIENAFACQQAKSLQHLKKHSLAGIYQYLTFKALEAPPGKQKRLQTARFFLKCIKYNRSLLLQKRLMLLTMIKFIFPGFTHYFKQVKHLMRELVN